MNLDGYIGQPNTPEVHERIKADMTAQLNNALHVTTNSLHSEFSLYQDIREVRDRLDMMSSEFQALMKENAVLRSQNEEIWKLLRELQAHRETA